MHNSHFEDSHTIFVVSVFFISVRFSRETPLPPMCYVDAKVDAVCQPRHVIVSPVKRAFSVQKVACLLASWTTNVSRTTWTLFSADGRSGTYNFKFDPALEFRLRDAYTSWLD